MSRRTTALVSWARGALWGHPYARAALALSMSYAQTSGRAARPANTRPRPLPAGSTPALGLLLALLPALAVAACPTPADMAEGTALIPAGCPAPVAGRLYTADAHAATAADLAALDSLAEDLDAQVLDARAERDRARAEAAADLADAAKRIDALALQVAALADPPRRTVWLALGGAAGVGAVVVSDLAGLDSLTSAGLGVGTLALGALVGAWLDQ